MTLDRARATLVMEDMKMVLKVIGAKYDLNLGNFNLKYTKDGVSVKFDMTLEGGLTPQEKKYDTYRAKFNLPPRGTVIMLDGTDYKLVGLRFGGPHKMVLLERLSDGKGMKISVRGLTAKIGL